MAKISANTNTMEYKGYTSVVEYDDEAGLLHGEVIQMKDVITFQGACVEELREAFRDSVEDYLAFCAARGEAPEKPFSGRLPLRLKPELHSRVFVRAKQEGKSINGWINEVIERALG